MSEPLSRELKDTHCTDCCCARSWEALGVTTYTGMSIVEHIAQLQAQLAALTLTWTTEKPNVGGWYFYRNEMGVTSCKYITRLEMEFYEAGIKSLFSIPVVRTDDNPASVWISPQAGEWAGPVLAPKEGA